MSDQDTYLATAVKIRQLLESGPKTSKQIIAHVDLDPTSVEYRAPIRILAQQGLIKKVIKRGVGTTWELV